MSNACTYYSGINGLSSMQNVVSSLQKKTENIVGKVSYKDILASLQTENTSKVDAVKSTAEMTMEEYQTYIWEKKPATLTRRLTAIGTVHEEAGLQNPVHASIVRLTLAGIKREKGTRQTAKAPVRVEDLRRLMAMNVFHGLTGLRDRALLLLGFAAALRRSELANVRAEDLTFTGAGAVLLLPRSKADQQGKGTEIALPYAEDPALCPVRALMAWMSAAHLQQGPIFQSIDLRANLSGKPISPRTVAEIVKRYAAKLGYDESQFSGHSLRRGFATEASRSGASLPAIMHHTRHKSERQALRYVETGRNFMDSPLKRII